MYAAAAAKSLQSCLTLGDPIDGSPPGSVIPGILQARTLEWVAISLFYAYCVLSCINCVQLFAAPWTIAHQFPLPWEFPGKNTGVGCRFLLQGNFLTQGSNPSLPHCRQTLYCLNYQGSPRDLP